MLSRFSVSPRFTSVALSLSMCFALTCADVAANPRVSEWKQAELRESFMRSLTKAQCMSKMLASLTTGCQSEQCLKTLAGITGDCIEYSRGSLSEFCAGYDREYLSSYCWTNELDARSCQFLQLGKQTACKTK